MKAIKNEVHTPAPWEVYRMGTYFGIDSGTEPNNKTIVTFGDGDDDLAGVRGDTNEEMMANARLIAAAPEMLEALQRALDYMKEFGCTDQLELDRIKNVIYKATQQ